MRRPCSGRYFSAAEDSRPMGALVAVISHAMWKSEFASARRDRPPIKVGKLTYTIIGVAPEGFVGTVAGRSSRRVRPDHDHSRQSRAVESARLLHEVQLGLDRSAGTPHSRCQCRSGVGGPLACLHAQSSGCASDQSACAARFAGPAARHCRPREDGGWPGRRDRIEGAAVGQPVLQRSCCSLPARTSRT